MKRILTFQLLMLWSIHASSQSFVWVQSAPVNYQMNPSYPEFAVALDEPNGKVYSTRLANNVLIYGSELYGEQLLECRDLNGSLIWNVSLGGKVVANHITTDDNGNVYLSGSFMDTLFIGTSGFLANTSSGIFSTNGYLIKFDGNGNVLWKRNLSLTWPLINYVNAMDVDPSGNCWYAFTDFLTGQIVQLDAAGNDVAIHTVEGLKTLGNISFDPWGGLYVSGGASNGLFIMDTDTFFVTDQYNMFVARFQPDGDPHWVEFAHDITFQRPVVVADDFGFAYVTGTRCDTTSFGSVSFNQPSSFCDFFVTRTDSLGNFQWGLAQPPLIIGPFGNFEMGSNIHAAADGSGNLYFTGIHRGTVDWGGGLTSSTPSFSDRRIGVVKVSPAGQAQWVKIGGSADINQSHALAAGNSGDCYITGFVSDTAAFDTIQVINTNDRNFILAKIGSGTVSLPENHEHETAYFNALNGMFTLNENWLGAEVYFYDASGRMILSMPFVSETVNDLTAFAPGIYLVQMKKAGKVVTGKWVR